MENYGIDMKGNIQMENVSTLPSWTSADERRVIYVADEDKTYYGSGTRWEHMVNDTYYNRQHNMGWLKRPHFEWVSNSSIYIYPGAYHYDDGVSEKVVYWNDRLTFVFGSGGSNAISDDLSNSQWHHLYLHKSSIDNMPTNELDETCFMNSSTAPPSILTTGGYGNYFGTSRLIYAVYSNSSSYVERFTHSNNYTEFIEDQAIQTPTAMATGTWTTVNLRVPLITNVSSMANVSFTFEHGGDSLTNKLLWTNNTSYTGHIGVKNINAEIDTISNTTNVICEKSSGRIYIKGTDEWESDLGGVDQHGWYMPDGM